MAGAAVSLVEAIKQKYDSDGSNEISNIKYLKEAALSHKPGHHPVQERTTLVLENLGIMVAGSHEDLERLCPKVREVYLSSNSISDWTEISIILSRLKAAIFLDLTFNPLCSDSFITPSSSPPSSPLSSSLSTLVLNSVSITSPAVQTCLDALPSLEELHLTNNGYQTVTFRPGSRYPKLLRLFIGQNKLSQWEDLQVLGEVFPSLTFLMAASNPLVVVPLLDKDTPPLPCLSVLNLNSTLIDSWDSVDHLTSLPSLTELSILHVPLGRDMKEKQRRFEAIARLPRLRLLNKSSISSEERDDAERWLIRNHKGLQTQTPASFPALLEKHGALDPLVDVSLTPTCDVDLKFHISGRDPEVHRISLYQTTYELKVWLSKMLGVRPGLIRLHYGDIEAVHMYGLEEMTYNSKALYTYRMKPGDCIYVEFK